MKTVGELLKSARQEKQLTLDQIAGYTKIHKVYLEAIEANHFDKLPASAFTKGFLHTYASLVGCNPKTILAIFRRDYDQDGKGRIIPRSLIDPIRAAPLGVTPGLLTVGLSVLAGIIVIGFFVRQIVIFSETPPLNLIEPTEKALVDSPITIRGTTDSQASVVINNQTIVVNQNGEFSTQMKFSPGEHTLVLISTSRAGKKTTLERVVYIQAPL